MRRATFARLGAPRRRSLATAVERGQTLIEKVVSRHAVDLPNGKTKVYSGDYVTISPKHVMTHDNTGPVISKFAAIGASRIHNPRQPVFAIDHDIQNTSAANLRKYANIEKFAHENDIDFYPPGTGIGHQVMIEEGYAFPGEMTVASDSHSNMYGGVGCVGTAIVRTDAAALWATGKTWWQVPPMVRIELTGRLAPGVTGKDVIVALCGYFNNDEVLNCAIEFVGEGVKTLSVDERLAISNMTTEFGALIGVFPVDDVLRQWYETLVGKLDSRGYRFGSAKAGLPTHPRLSSERISSIPELRSDANAVYAKTLTLDLSSLVPHVSGPNSVKVATPLPVLEEQDIKIHKAYLVSCTNSRLSDLKAAADVLRGHQVADGVEFYVAAASANVQREAEASGDWATLVGAGAKVLPAGCGPCIGLGTGLLQDGEVGISATNRNYKGRMGSPKALAYLASPAVVAASAIAGKIAGPSSLGDLPPVAPPKRSFKLHDAASSDAETSSSAPALLHGFPAIFSGELLWTPQDNLNTDALYPGKYTYQDDITPDRQAEVVMENYDPAFASLVASIRPPKSTEDGPANTSRTGKGVFLCAGLNFGTGSSREQAATALRNAGIPVVLAASFGDIFKRNAINNGLICIEAPELVRDLNQEFKTGPLTHRTGWHLDIDMGRGEIKANGKIYRVGPTGESVQQVWLAGSLEGWVKERL